MSWLKRLALRGLFHQRSPVGTKNKTFCSYGHFFLQVQSQFHRPCPEKVVHLAYTGKPGALEQTTLKRHQSYQQEPLPYSFTSNTLRLHRIMDTDAVVCTASLAAKDATRLWGLPLQDCERSSTIEIVDGGHMPWRFRLAAGPFFWKTICLFEKCVFGSKTDFL